MDVAKLGIQVETNGTERATSELNKITGAAGRAEAATEGLADANRGATGAAAAAARAYANEGSAAASASKQIEMANRAANQNNAGLMRTHNTANLAAQGFDIVTTAAGGMNAGLIGMQQGLQIAQVAMTTNGSFAKALAASFMAMLSPITFVSIALTALAAVAIQSVEWSKLLASALMALADALEVIAPYAIAAAAALALLYAPAIIGGLISVIALLGRMAVAAVTAAAAIIAANPLGALVLGITAAVAAANIFRDELAQIFGRDIVADAKKGVNFIIGAFVGGFNGIKAAWAQLPAAIGDVVFTTAAFVLKGTELMVNKVIKMISDFIGSVYDGMSGLASKVGIDLGKFGGIGEVSFGQISNPFKGKAMEAGSIIASEMSAAQGTDYVGGVTDMIARGASAASEKLKGLAKDLVDVDEKAKKGGKGGGGQSEAEKYSDIVDGANRRIASLKAEQEGLGMTEQAAAALRYEQDLLNQAQQRGIELTAAQKTELTGLAEKMAATEAETKAAKEQLEFAKDATGGFLSDLRSGLRSGEGFWRSFGNAALNVLDKIIDRGQDLLVDGLFGGGGGKGGGGILGAVFGGLGKLLGFNANGTNHWRGGLTVVGERGPEIVNAPRGSQIIPNHRINGAPANSNAPQKVDFNINVSGARGNKEIEDMVAAGVQQGIGQYDKGFDVRLNQALERTG